MYAAAWSRIALWFNISYRKDADLLRMLLSPAGGTTHTTNRSRATSWLESPSTKRFDRRSPKIESPINGREYYEGHRISTARVELTADQLVDWRMEEKQHLRWT